MFDLGRIGGPGQAIFTVGFVVAALIVAAFPAIKMIGWWIDGGAEPWMAALALFLYIALIAMGMAAPAGIAILIFLLILASALAAPYIGKVSDKAQLRRIDEHQMQQYAAALEQNPTNHAARIALAELLHKQGEVDHAIEHMSWILQQSPRMMMRVRPTLDRWIREKERAVPTTKPIICHECYEENLPWATECERCGAKFGSRQAIGERIRLEGGPAVVIRGWIVSALALIAVVMLFAWLPIEFAAPLAVASLIVLFWLFLRWVGGDMGRAGE